MKCTQDISQSTKELQYYKQEFKSNREQEYKSSGEQRENQSQTQSICFEVRATALLPAFTAVKGFHYPPRNFTRSTEDWSTELHQYNPLPKRYLNKNKKKEQVAKWSPKRSQTSYKLLFTTSL